MTFVVTPEGQARQRGMRRVGRILPTYGAESIQVAVEQGYRVAGYGDVDGVYCALFAQLGWRYFVVRRLFWLRDHAGGARRWVIDLARGVAGAARRWWLREGGYIG